MSAKSTATSRINLRLHHYLCLSSNSNRSLHFHFHFHFHTIETTSCIYYLLDITIAAWQQSHNLLLCFLCKFTNVTLHISNCYLFLCRLLSGLMNELVRFALISVNTNRQPATNISLVSLPAFLALSSPRQLFSLVISFFYLYF